MVLDQNGTERAVSALPMMYIPCLALESKTLILLLVLRKPTLRSGFDRTNETMTTSASSP